METRQLYAKAKKYILNGQGCMTGTDECMHERTDTGTYESDFIGSLSDKSGAPKVGEIRITEPPL